MTGTRASQGYLRPQKITFCDDFSAQAPWTFCRAGSGSCHQGTSGITNLMVVIFGQLKHHPGFSEVAEAVEAGWGCFGRMMKGYFPPDGFGYECKNDSSASGQQLPAFWTGAYWPYFLLRERSSEVLKLPFSFFFLLFFSWFFSNLQISMVLTIFLHIMDGSIINYDMMILF